MRWIDIPIIVMLGMAVGLMLQFVTEKSVELVAFLRRGRPRQDSRISK